MPKTVDFYRCRACWTLKVVDRERDPMANSLEHIPCTACKRTDGYTHVHVSADARVADD